MSSSSYAIDDEGLRLLANLEQHYASWIEAADKPGRNPLKRPKDRKQGELLLAAIAQRMPDYPLDDEFRADLPEPLQAYFDEWHLRSR